MRMRDGFFHADMHPGNLFVDAEGRIVAVDFGIMGRLEPMERRFMAEMLHGFLTRDYRRVAEVHFEVGYVPRRHSVGAFAQALRAIGEPIFGQAAPARFRWRTCLGSSSRFTDVFDMQMQPQLVLLQKTMVVVEGVARDLDPELNMWKTAEPVVKTWMESQIGPEAQIEAAAESASRLASSWATFRSCSARPSASPTRSPPWRRRGCGLTTDR